MGSPSRRWSFAPSMGRSCHPRRGRGVLAPSLGSPSLRWGFAQAWAAAPATRGAVEHSSAVPAQEVDVEPSATALKRKRGSAAEALAVASDPDLLAKAVKDIKGKFFAKNVEG
eukprot:9962257-Heterocapsa_arctica.AAC.1